MKDFIEEIRHRKVVQWVAGYAATAWILVEVLDTLGGVWGWDPVVARVATVLLAVGVLAAATLAWFHGERGRQIVHGPEAVLLILIAALGIALTVGVVRTNGSIAGEEVAASTAGDVEAGASLVVLPFADNSPGGGGGYLGDGIAETLIIGLGRLEELRVVARTSAFALRDEGLGIDEIARRLGVQTVLEGTVTQVGDRVRVTANLIDATSQTALWNQMFDREVSAADLFALQDDIAREIVEGLRVQLTGGRAIVRGGTQSAEALAAYNLGQHHWTARTTEDMALAAEYFHEAIEADSSYADAWGGLALAYSLHTPSEYNVPGITATEALAQAETAARRALELDPDSEFAYAALGDIALQRRTLDQAMAAFTKAIELNPGYATAHHWLADTYMLALRADEALTEIRIDESQSPLAPAILVEHAQALLMLGRHEETATQLHTAAERAPDAILVHTFAVWFWMRMERWEETARSLEKAALVTGHTPEEAATLRTLLENPTRRTQFVRQWADGEEVDAPMNAELRDQIFRRPEVRVVAAVLLDGPDRALSVLEEAITGPEAEGVYGPVLPALLGPDLWPTERARTILSLLRAPSEEAGR